MAQPHYSEYESDTYYAAIESAAKRWAQLFDFAQGSELKKAYEDEDYFSRIAEGEYAGRVAPLAFQERQQVDATRASAYARGVGGFGAVEKRVGEIGAGGVAQRSAIRAELEAAAERSRVENEGQWFEMMSQVGEAEQGVISTQQALARRLGEQTQYDPDYAEWKHYAPHGEYSERFFDYMDWGEGGASAAGDTWYNPLNPRTWPRPPGGAASETYNPNEMNNPNADWYNPYNPRTW